MGPAASLAARDLGMDFAGADGWRMYHGSVVPGFPQHPHRGFETVTFVRQGFIDHSDSLGATARFGRGDVQWLTAGEGIVHCEMFPLLDRDGPNPCELFQIWLNLPAADKMVEPVLHDAVGRGHPAAASPPTTTGARTEITVDRRASSPGLRPPPPPPDSWASRPEADLAIWHVVLEPRRAVDAAARARAPRPCARSTSSRARCASATTTSRRRPARCCVADEPVVVTGGPVRRRGARAAGPADRRAGRAVRPVRDERRGRHRAGLRRLPRAPASAAGRGRPTIRCIPARRDASPATPTGDSRCRQASTRLRASRR